MRLVLLGACVLAGFIPGHLAAQGKLQSVREEVNRPAEQEEDRKKKDKDCQEDDEGFFSTQSGVLLTSDESGAGCEPSGSEPSPPLPSWCFLRYPYADEKPGYLRRVLVDSPASVHLRDWGGQISLENGNDFDGLNRTGVRLFLDTSTRFGLQARYDYFTERLTGGSDNLSIGSAELTFCFLRDEIAQVYAGIGGRFLDDRGGTNGGFNFTLGTDIYPARPVVLSFSLDAGTLGSADYLGARGSVGVLYKGWEIFTGYDYRCIGQVGLDGLLFGLRRWY